MPGIPTDPEIWVPLAAIAKKATSLDDFVERSRKFLRAKQPWAFTKEGWRGLQGAFGVIDVPEKVPMGISPDWITTDISSTTVAPELGEGLLSPDIYVAEKLVKPFRKGGKWYAMINAAIHNRSKTTQICRPKVTDLLTGKTWVGPPLRLGPDALGLWLGYTIELIPPPVGDPGKTDHCLVFEAQVLRG